MKFSPYIHPTVDRFLSDKDNLEQLLNAFGSPLNIIFPEISGENLNNFKKVLDEKHVRGRVYYAHKTNKSSSIPRYLSFQDSFIDVASLNELKSALTNGFAGERIEATGPKDKEFMILGIQHEVLFNIDNMQELFELVNLSKVLSLRKKIKVLVRFSGFTSERVKIINKDSRFGIAFDEYEEVLKYLKENEKIIDFVGVSFHLDTVEMKEKLIAIESSLEIVNAAFELALDPSVLNIGGGFKTNYLSSKEDWEYSITKLKESILNADKSLTWNGQSFGLKKDKGALKGALNIYSYYDEVVGSDYLKKLLETPLERFGKRSFGTILCENMLDLYIEPGKSLVANAGITVARVAFVKKSAKGEILIGLSMKKTDVVFEEQEIFIDPVIIYKQESNIATDSKEVGVYFVGNLCLESDLIFKHKIFLERLPTAGDKVVFINTAGYFMDFSRSDTIKQRIATKLAFVEREDGFRWYLDENYQPIQD